MPGGVRSLVTAPADSDEVAAPDFNRSTLKGGMFQLSDFRGKIVVLNFWATWCGPCRDEIPDFVELQEQMADDVQFVGVALDEEGAEVVQPFAKKYEINYPIVVDDSAEVARKYGGVRALPTTYVINREGNIRYRTPGRLPKEILEEALTDMIDS
jgi:peroxiredoxin